MISILAEASGGAFDPLKHFVNQLTQPGIFLTLSTIVFILMFVLYKFWTKPAVSLTLFVLFLIGYFGSMGDPNYRSIVSKPDNVPITIMLISVMICIWISFRRAALNDTRISQGLPLLEEEKDDKVLVWPDLVYTELICLVLATAGLTRLGLAHRVSRELSPPDMFPAVSQGIVGVECRADDMATRALLAGITDPATLAAATAERSLLFTLRAGCHAPLGVATQLENETIHLEAVILPHDGSHRWMARASATIANADALGQQVAQLLMAQGVNAVLHPDG